MNAYIFQAALLCEACGEATRDQIHADGHAPISWDDESSYDSDQFPKGPFPQGGGEADCPQHCDQCGKFLKNPLTSDGVAYIREKFNEVEDTSGFDCPLDWSEFAERIAENHPVLSQWSDYYSDYF